jgi:pSer/pThr/pTyr-binding forkhead associated (FHA) protein
MNVKLLLVRGQPQGKTLLFPQGEFVFGRGEECQIRPNSSWVSRQHCLLRVTDAGAQLRDLGSTNGTLINGVRLIGERPLAPGDQIQVGPLVFEVLLEDASPVKRETGVHYLETAEIPSLSEKRQPAAPTAPIIEPAVKPPSRH